VESIEASGKSVEEAVQQALIRLGKRRDEVEVTVLQEPSRGAFGLGSREARVRVTVRPGRAAVITPEMADAILSRVESEEEDFLSGGALQLQEEFDDEEEFGEDEEQFEEDEEEFAVAPSESASSQPAPAAAPQSLPPEQAAAASAASAPGETAAGSEASQEIVRPTREDIEITVDVLQHILRYMNIRAGVQVRSTDPLTLNIQGIHENLGLLIGRRGETLSALQLLVNLIVSHRTRRRMRIIVDAENYRQRREENLRSLALRVAQQVRNYRRSIALEAMPPHERRIVHLALADSQDISTESIGEGDARRVVISLKRPGR
jgi:spoIIIJ-associated protein